MVGSSLQGVSSENGFIPFDWCSRHLSLEGAEPRNYWRYSSSLPACRLVNWGQREWVYLAAKCDLGLDVSGPACFLGIPRLGRHQQWCGIPVLQPFYSTFHSREWGGAVLRGIDQRPPGGLSVGWDFSKVRNDFFRSKDYILQPTRHWVARVMIIKVGTR